MRQESNAIFCILDEVEQIAETQPTALQAKLEEAKQALFTRQFTHGQAFEKLNAEQAVFSIRLNKGKRLIVAQFDIDGHAVWAVLDLDLTHDYNSWVLRNKYLSQFIALQTERIRQHIAKKKTGPGAPEYLTLSRKRKTTEEAVVEPEPTDTKPVELQLYKQNAIQLLPTQHEMLQQLVFRHSTKRPHINVIAGTAGSGKTLISCQLIQQLTEQSERSEMPPSIYVAENKTLRDEVCKECGNDYVSYMDYKALLARLGVDLSDKTEVSDTQLTAFYSANCEGDITYEDMVEEFKIIAVLDTIDDYYAIGGKHSLFHTKQTLQKKLWDLYESYNRQLNEANQYDLRFSQFDITTTSETIVIDEALDYSPIQLWTLMQASDMVTFAGDQNQNLNHVSNNIEILATFAQRVLKITDKQTHFLRLEQTLRCGINIAQAASNILELAKRVVTHGSSLVDNKTESGLEVQGNVYTVTTSQSDQLKDLCQSAATAVITTPDQVEPLRLSLNASQVFSIEGAKGLEFETIILWNIISDELASQLFTLYTEGKKTRGELTTDVRSLAPKLHHLFTAITRAKRQVIFMLPNIKKPAVKKLMELILKDIVNENETINATEASTAEQWQAQMNLLFAQGSEESIKAAQKIKHNFHSQMLALIKINDRESLLDAEYLAQLFDFDYHVVTPTDHPSTDSEDDDLGGVEETKSTPAPYNNKHATRTTPVQTIEACEVPKLVLQATVTKKTKKGTSRKSKKFTFNFNSTCPTPVVERLLSTNPGEFSKFTTQHIYALVRNIHKDVPSNLCYKLYQRLENEAPGGFDLASIFSGAAKNELISNYFISALIEYAVSQREIKPALTDNILFLAKQSDEVKTILILHIDRQRKGKSSKDQFLFRLLRLQPELLKQLAEITVDNARIAEKFLSILFESFDSKGMSIFGVLSIHHAKIISEYIIALTKKYQSSPDTLDRLFNKKSAQKPFQIFFIALASKSPQFFLNVAKCLKFNKALADNLIKCISNIINGKYQLWHYISLKSPNALAEIIKLFNTYTSLQEKFIQCAEYTSRSSKFIWFDIAQNSPECLVLLVKMARSNTELGNALIKATRVKHDDQWSLWHNVARYAPEGFCAMVDFATENKEMMSSLLELVNTKNCDGFTVWHMLARHNADAFFKLIEHSRTNHRLRSKCIEAFSMYNNAKWSISHGLTMHSAKALSAMIDLAQEDAAIYRPFIDGLSTLTFQHESAWFRIPELAPNCLTKLISLSARDDRLRKQFIASLGIQSTADQSSDRSGRSAWTQIAQHTPACLTQLVKEAQYDDDLYQSLVTSVNKSLPNGYNLWHFAAINAPEAFAILIDMASKDKALLSQLLNTAMKKLGDGDTLWEIVATRQPLCFNTLLALTKTSKQLYQQMLSTLKATHTDRLNAWARILNCSSENFISLVELAESDERVMECLANTVNQKAPDENLWHLAYYKGDASIHALIRAAKNSKLLRKKLVDSISKPNLYGGNLWLNIAYSYPQLFTVLHELAIQYKPLYRALLIDIATPDNNNTTLWQVLVAIQPDLFAQLFQLIKINKHLYQQVLNILALPNIFGYSLLHAIIAHDSIIGLQTILQLAKTDSCLLNILVGTINQKVNTNSNGWHLAIAHSHKNFRALIMMAQGNEALCHQLVICANEPILGRPNLWYFALEKLDEENCNLLLQFAVSNKALQEKLVEAIQIKTGGKQNDLWLLLTKRYLDNYFIIADFFYDNENIKAILHERIERLSDSDADPKEQKRCLQWILHRHVEALCPTEYSNNHTILSHLFNVSTPYNESLASELIILSPKIYIKYFLLLVDKKPELFSSLINSISDKALHAIAEEDYALPKLIQLLHVSGKTVPETYLMFSHLLQIRRLDSRTCSEFILTHSIQSFSVLLDIAEQDQDACLSLIESLPANTLSLIASKPADMRRFACLIQEKPQTNTKLAQLLRHNDASGNSGLMYIVMGNGSLDIFSNILVQSRTSPQLRETVVNMLHQKNHNGISAFDLIMQKTDALHALPIPAQCRSAFFQQRNCHRDIAVPVVAIAPAVMN